MAAKYKGTALYVRWESGGGTVVLTAESRTFTEDETANDIDVTVRGDTAKNTLPDFPAITAEMSGLDPVVAASGTADWDKLNIGDAGTLIWAPEGTATGKRKRSLVSTVKGKGFDSPYDGAVSWKLSWNSNGGTVVPAFW